MVITYFISFAFCVLAAFMVASMATASKELGKPKGYIGRKLIVDMFSFILTH